MVTALGWLTLVALPLAAAALLAWWWQQERHASVRTAILCYHRLVVDDRAIGNSAAPADDEQGWVVTQAEFRSQIAALVGAGIPIVDLDAWLAARSGREPMARRSVILTFDDGYTSALELAVPVLQQYGAKAVFYIAVAPDAESHEKIAGRDSFLSADQIAELHRAGHTIGSHTMTHCLLRELDAEAVDWQLRESKSRLAKMVGAPVDHFCIPRAGGLPRHRRAIAAAGYLTATGNAKGTADLGHDLLRLPRHTVVRGTSGARLLRDLAPAGQVRARCAGELRRLASALLGPRLAYGVRQRLYHSPARHLLGPQQLATTLSFVGALWLLAAVAFVIWQLPCQC